MYAQWFHNSCYILAPKQKVVIAHSRLYNCQDISPFTTFCALSYMLPTWSSLCSTSLIYTANPLLKWWRCDIWCEWLGSTALAVLANFTSQLWYRILYKQMEYIHTCGWSSENTPALFRCSSWWRLRTMCASAAFVPINRRKQQEHGVTPLGGVLNGVIDSFGTSSIPLPEVCPLSSTTFSLLAMFCKVHSWLPYDKTSRKFSRFTINIFTDSSGSTNSHTV